MTMTHHTPVPLCECRTPHGCGCLDDGCPAAVPGEIRLHFTPEGREFYFADDAEEVFPGLDLDHPDLAARAAIDGIVLVDDLVRVFRLGEGDVGRAFATLVGGSA